MTLYDVKYKIYCAILLSYLYIIRYYIKYIKYRIKYEYNMNINTKLQHYASRMLQNINQPIPPNDWFIPTKWSSTRFFKIISKARESIGRVTLEIFIHVNTRQKREIYLWISGNMFEGPRRLFLHSFLHPLFFFIVIIRATLPTVLSGIAQNVLADSEILARKRPSKNASNMYIQSTYMYVLQICEVFHNFPP